MAGWGSTSCGHGVGGQHRTPGRTGRRGEWTRRHQATSLTSRRPGITVASAYPDILDRAVPPTEARVAASLSGIRERVFFLRRRGGGPSRWAGGHTGASPLWPELISAAVPAGKLAPLMGGETGGLPPGCSCVGRDSS